MVPDRVYFEANRASLQLLGGIDLPRGRPSQVGAFRRAQLGAVFAVGAHFSVNHQPAIVSLPTGAGKTATMTVLPFALSARRVLVVTPTKLLRSQIGSEFASLHVLRSTGVVPEAFIPPSVREVASRLSDASMWSDLLRFDVVIGTPNVLSPAIAGVAAPPDDLFDLIVFDEAHHTPAQTYGAILSAFPVARAVLFTATPFRRDRQPLPGTPAYSYGLAQALDEEILAPIRFLPVDVPAGADEATRDRTLAQAAKARLET